MDVFDCLTICVIQRAKREKEREINERWRGRSGWVVVDPEGPDNGWRRTRTRKCQAGIDGNPREGPKSIKLVRQSYVEKV